MVPFCGFIEKVGIQGEIVFLRYWTRPDRNLHELEHYELERKARYFDSPGGRGDGVSTSCICWLEVCCCNE